MGEMVITIKHEPERRTGFERGDIIGYPGSAQGFLIVGEDDVYLHTFMLDSGNYWGVLKRAINLDSLELKHGRECILKPVRDILTT